jgi:hypothetical protein
MSDNRSKRDSMSVKEATISSMLEIVAALKVPVTFLRWSR